jgi:AhpD family alkylhydroperoxidase
MTFDDRLTELIAIGASIGANCQSCVEYHVGKAAECGLDEQDVAQAIEIGRMVRRGAAAKVDKVAETLRRSNRAASAAGTPGGCGCGTAR